ncbi:MAG: NPCBM/NEW2 domain-containing protein [Phycisphaerae bacterium]
MHDVITDTRHELRDDASDTLRRLLAPRSDDSGLRRFNEALTLFVTGVLVVAYLYDNPGGASSADAGVPGHDSFYHIKMAALLPELGLTSEFPWLRFAYFTDEGHAFISHHYGFHLLLAPFVQLSKLVTGDYLAGGRWATAVCFGLVLVCFHRVLIAGGVPWRWFWVLLFFLLPTQFFFRHALVRAVGPSLVFMLLITWFLVQRRWFWTGVATAAFVHLYLGAVMYAPVLIGCFFVASLLAPRDRRSVAVKCLIGGVAGWIVGILTHPYSAGMLEFLRLQVFGTGLSPDIRVGSEWRPYEGVWWFATTLAGGVLTVWVLTLLARLRSGIPLNDNDFALLLIHLAFMVLTLKARRFIEYWPAFCLLNAAFLASPLLERMRTWHARGGTGGASRGAKLLRGGAALLLGAVCAGAVIAAVWTGTLAAAMRAPQLLIAAAMCAACVLLNAGMASRGGAWRRAGRLAGVSVLLAGGVSGAALASQANLASVQRDARCLYDLPALRELMAHLVSVSRPGDVVFTDDWDVFPVYFYHNSYNNYIVGLDPKFTHQRRPDLWERFVAISRGKVPADADVRMPDGARGRRPERIHIELEDIREHFGAKFVITDRDHNALATRLYQSPQFAELIHPDGPYLAVRDRPFLLWRVREPGEAVSRPAPEQFDLGGVLYLSFLDPAAVEQGWGELRIDRSVSGDPIIVGGQTHLRGLGTHAPSRLVYEIPEGYERFEATVGVDGGPASCGGTVVVSVRLDGTEVWTSDLLTPAGEAERVSIPLGAARRIELRADATDDGMRCDHVDWASARLVRVKEE